MWPGPGPMRGLSLWVSCLACGVSLLKQCDVAG